MISKLGMARVALGVAAEHEGDNIAGNTLWPRTIIETQASIGWKMADRSQWRTPEIVCDASLAIFAQEPRYLHRAPVDRRGRAHLSRRHRQLRPLLV
jgi:citronellol/citronellal dehydrogenase